MEWIQDILFNHSAIQAVIIISMIIALGLALGKLHFWGISLGVTWVFFAGIFAGYLGFSIDSEMLVFAESFGLALFIYELGLKVGPGFFNSFKKGGIIYNLWGLAAVLFGTGIAVLLSCLFGVSMADMVGIISGATTNTPALGAAQQALKQLGISSSGAALSCAVTYPLGVIGVILAIIVMRRTFVRPSDLVNRSADEEDVTYIATFQVKNPAIYGKNIQEIANLSTAKFIVSRLWRNGQVSIPASDTIIEAEDRLMAITEENNIHSLEILFGKLESRDWNTGEVDWNKIDSNLISRHLIISKPELNGKKLGSLKLRNSYGINITRVLRSGVNLLAKPGLVLQLGDRLTVVGKESQIQEVEKLVGNRLLKLKDPNLAAIFIGLVLGLLLGSVPLFVPGISVPVKLGLAGGPIIMGILIGRFGPQFRIVTYTTRSANLMLRGIGLSLFLACLGLDSGKHFIDTIMNGDGLLWIGLGFIITVVPVLIIGWLAMRVSRLDFGSTCGMLCGAMANPMALTYANDIVEGDSPSVSYATVYPVAMFSRVIISQILVLCFLQ